MNRKNFKVLIFSSAGNPISEKVWSSFPSNLIDELTLLAPNLRFVPISVKLSKYLDISIRFLDKLTINSSGTSFLRRLALSSKSFLYIRKEKPVAVLYFGTDSVPWFFKKQSMVQILIVDSVLEQWEGKTTWWRESSEKSWQRQSVYEHLAVHHCDYIISLTNSTSEILRTKYLVPEERNIVVGTGFGNKKSFDAFIESAQNMNSSVDYFVVSTVARQRILDKGLDLLVESIKQIRTELEINLVLNIFGPSVNSLENHNYINFYDNIPFADYTAILGYSDLFAMPARFEPYGLAFLDAAMLQIPILASRDAGIAAEMSDFTQTVICEPIIPEIKKSIVCFIKKYENKELTRYPLRNYSTDLFANSRFNWKKSAEIILQFIDK